MKGVNTLNMNQATMVEAMQHYFETVLFLPGRAPKVIEVKCVQNSVYGNQFTVEMQEKTPASLSNSVKGQP